MIPKTDESDKTRLPYEKPVLQSISLVADQVLGTGCKLRSADPTHALLGSSVPCVAKLCRSVSGS